MGSRSRGSKAKTKDAVKHPRLSTLVQSSPITKRRSSAGDHVRDQVDAKRVAFDSLKNGPVMPSWPQNLDGQKCTTPMLSRMTSSRQAETALGSDWVEVPSFSDMELDTGMWTSRSLTTLQDTNMVMSPRSESMRPPELRPRQTSSQMGDTIQQPEAAPSTKRLSISGADRDSSTKRTRPDTGYKTIIQLMKERNKDDDGNDSDTTSMAPDQPSEETAPALSFACPYYRRNPVAHQQCLGYRLNRIRDMKQHLFRRHYGATCYCPVCFRTFPSFNLRDEHIRCRNCVSKPSPVIDNLDAVSPNAQEQLKRKVDRTVSPVDQWHAVYEILFGKPGEKRVDPYMRGVVRETLGMVRAYLRATGSRIIPKVLESSGNQDAQSMNFERMMHVVFDEVETQFDNLADSRKVVMRTASARPTSYPGATTQQAQIPSVIKSENIVFSEPLDFSSEAPADGSTGYQPPGVSMSRSNTLAGTSDISSAPSSSSSDLALSWPPYYFQLNPTVENPVSAPPEVSPNFGYYIPESLNYSTSGKLVGFVQQSPPFSEPPTTYETESGLVLEDPWQESSSCLVGVGGGFQNPTYSALNTLL